MVSWKDYRQRRIAFFTAWIGGFAIFGLTCMLAQYSGRPLILILPVWAAWLISFFVAVSHLQRFRCPRCGEPFLHPFLYGRHRYRFLYPTECMNCGLPTYSDAKA